MKNIIEKDHLDVACCDLQHNLLLLQTWCLHYMTYKFIPSADEMQWNTLAQLNSQRARDILELIEWLHQRLVHHLRTIIKLAGNFIKTCCMEYRSWALDVLGKEHCSVTFRRHLYSDLQHELAYLHIGFSKWARFWHAGKPHVVVYNLHLLHYAWGYYKPADVHWKTKLKPSIPK